METSRHDREEKPPLRGVGIDQQMENISRGHIMQDCICIEVVFTHLYSLYV